ncbi:D-allulose 6-phosphate 3-epimerase [Oceanobacillus alkalisoli]|uniref:D-allulose 6-phosphate 3-epimerase n=1 Tax=Oceanobacillus alkalisoli TaxID=2925113 RepID=UPI001EE3EC8A|nr:D-allulose 6-phosphate 3-epimerase [Oceanobacillus alkalisoli]MCG5103221.1 ribulose-phosphate 3-epimerase [Oceanobacillus alkalisoli]
MIKQRSRGIYFAPSVMLIDIFKAKQQIEFLNENSHFFHIDIKDGNYVKSFGTTPMFIEQIKSITTVPIDAHLMVTNPWEHLDEIARSGANYITFHSDTVAKEAFRTINKIKSLGCNVGVAINPSASLNEIKHYLHLLDKVTVMTVDPGYAGQPFIMHMLDKIKDLVKIREENGFDFLIEADGSIDEKVYQELYEAGIDIIVLGGPALFNKNPNINEAWNIMMNNFESATNKKSIH